MALCGNNHPNDNYTVRCQLCSAAVYGAEPVREWITTLEADKEYVFSRDEVKRNAVEVLANMFATTGRIPEATDLAVLKGTVARELFRAQVSREHELDGNAYFAALIDALDARLPEQHRSPIARAGRAPTPDKATNARELPAHLTAINDYITRARVALDAAEAPATSYIGIWLLLNRFSSLAGHDAAFRDALGHFCEDSPSVAEQLLAEEHPTLAAAAEGWLAATTSWRPDPSSPDPVPLQVLPDAAALDRWASDHTRGLITTFPLEVTPLTQLVLAAALVLTPRWSEPMDVTDDQRLKLWHWDGRHTIVATRAAGLVAVAIPNTADGIDVLSVIAAPEVSAHDVWRAVDEVVQLLNTGQLQWYALPAAALGGGHAWAVRFETHEINRSETCPTRWTATLPAWRTEETTDIAGAPGIAELWSSIAPRLDPPGDSFNAVQSLTANYDRDGFTAAAVTAMGGYATGAPQWVDRELAIVDVDFGRSHAVVAVARGGAWDGIPLVHCWVTSEMWVTPNGEHTAAH